MKFFYLYCFLLFSNLLNSQTIRIGIFNNEAIDSFVFTPNNSSYSVYGDTSYVLSFLKKDTINVIKKDSLLILKKENDLIGIYSKINFVQDSLNSSLFIIPQKIKLKKRNLKGDFKLNVINDKLHLINIVDMYNYLSSVVLSEAGGNKSEEYYKVQVILSRTYALKHSNKHAKENFDLCDGIHCQVYRREVNNSNHVIYDAVRFTKDLVIVDTSLHLIGAFFHANCGGQTAETNQVWNKKITFLNSFRDTFCIHTKQSNWTKKIPKKEWRDYLQTTFFLSVNKKEINKLLYNFKQPYRKTFFLNPKHGIPLRDVRHYFNLKSTFFDCYDNGDYVLIKGRGFGHGVGLCQEGAMEMAKQNFTFDEIIHYYFPTTKIIKKQRLLKSFIHK